MLRAYEQWGPSCVERFNGMWAIALWDGRRRRLFCSRDRFGIKPFVFRVHGDRLAFASEPRALLRDPSFRARPNPAAIRDFLAQGHTDHLEETFFTGVRQLPPGHSLTFDADGLRLDALLDARAERPAGRPGRSVQGALPRLDPPASPQRRAARHRPLRRARFVRRGGRDRPPAADGEGACAAGRRAAADVHRLLRGRRLRRAPLRGGGCGADPLGAPVAHIRRTDVARRTAGCRRRSGGAVRVDERGRAVVRDARCGRG